MGRTLVRDVAIPGWGFLVLMEALGFHYLVPIYTHTRPIAITNNRSTINISYVLYLLI
jgi:hypothetical protein